MRWAADWLDSKNRFPMRGALTMDTTATRRKQATFDYVCQVCRKVHHHDLSALSPGHTFRCPYCKTVYGVKDGRIQALEVKINPASLQSRPRYVDQIISDS